MRGWRGLVVLFIAILLGLAAARAVMVYLQDARPQRDAQPEAAAKPEPPVKPVGLTESIPPGMRAVSIKVDEVTGVSRKVHRGDQVDVLATTSLPGSKDASVTRLILERLKVVEVSVDAESKVQSRIKGERDWTVTLLVTPEQGASLTAAAAQARISLLARRSDDPEGGKPAEVAFTHREGTANLQKPESSVIEWIRPGMRAVTLAIRDTDGICGALGRGDRVDVIITCPLSRFATGGDLSVGAEGAVTEFAMRSTTLLQDVEVLASEKSLEATTGEMVPVTKVTIQVTPHEAEIVAVAVDATKKSIIRLVSRNPHDRAFVRTPGQGLSDLLSEKKEFIRVDVYKGTKAMAKPFFR